MTSISHNHAGPIDDVRNALTVLRRLRDGPHPIDAAGLLFLHVKNFVVELNSNFKKLGW